MQTAYLEAVVNRTHRVLGRELHDLCLYDALFLTLRANPLWLRHREPQLADLIEAVLICSLPPERFLRAEMAPRGCLERWSRHRWVKKSGHLDFSAALCEWDAYEADFHARPEFWDAVDGKAARAPWVLHVASFIEQHSNMREREIMTAPLGQMLWKAASIAERNGTAAADLMTEEEIEIGAEQAEAIRQAGETFPAPREPQPEGEPE